MKCSRVDDYVRSKEAFRDTELPKEEFQRKEAPSQWVQRNDRTKRSMCENARRRPNHRPSYRPQEHHAPYVAPHRPHHDPRRPRDNRIVFTLESLVSNPKEILATEHQLSRPQPPPLVGTPSKNLHKYCDHNEKGHSTNDCFHLKKLLKIALEPGRRSEEKIHVSGRRVDECSHNIPPVLARDVSEEALMVEAEVEGYLVRPDTRGRRSVPTLVSQTATIYECRKVGKKHAVDHPPKSPESHEKIGRNLEAYVDDMVVKSKTEREMIADVAETFNNLRRINMKLNPKKCSFGVDEGKILRYMVTSEGIGANPAKTKDIAEMQSPKT
ncbi:hypothetical protein Tco_0315558 [Tanacetum coccineum]